MSKYWSSVLISVLIFLITTLAPSFFGHFLFAIWCLCSRSTGRSFFGPDDSGSDITQTVHACHLGEIWNKVDIFWLSMTLWLDRLNSYKMRLREKRRHCPSPARSPGHTDGRTTSCLIPWQPGILLRRLLYLSLKQKINVLNFKLISFYRIIYDNLIS